MSDRVKMMLTPEEAALIRDLREEHHRDVADASRNRKRSEIPYCKWEYPNGEHCALKAYPDNDGFCRTHSKKVRIGNFSDFIPKC
jgi:hypothetical protein